MPPHDEGLHDTRTDQFFLELPRIFEESSAQYVSTSYWISNEKIKNLGFELEYPDFRVGLKDTVAWFIRAGWIK